jgi:hypothetical protein
MELANRSGPDGGNAPREGASSTRLVRTWTLLATSLYLVLLILPWSLTCLMMFRPVQKPSYGNQGMGASLYMDADVPPMRRWLTATRAMNTIATVMALPVILALLDYAAARYSLRAGGDQGPGEDQGLTMAQLHGFAERGWAEAPLEWWRSSSKGQGLGIRRLRTRRRGTRLRFLGLVLLLLGELCLHRPTSLSGY